MFICNVKFDYKFLLKILFVIVTIVLFGMIGFRIYHMFHTNQNSTCLPTPNVANINSDNYTNILKSVHDNLDEYVGQKIHFTGYVYRVYDFSETQFVLARNMKVTSDNQTLVVGFLCNYKEASKFSDNTWVEITGKITKGDYHGDIPVIEIEEIQSCNKPQDDLVTPPDDLYIPTSALF